METKYTYSWEHKQYPKHKAVHVSEVNALDIIRRYLVHFDLPPCRLFTRTRANGGMYYPGSKKKNDSHIVVPYWPRLGLLIHELSHHLNHSKDGVAHDDGFKHSLVLSYKWADEEKLLELGEHLHFGSFGRKTLTHFSISPQIRMRALKDGFTHWDFSCPRCKSQVKVFTSPAPRRGHYECKECGFYM